MSKTFAQLCLTTAMVSIAKPTMLVRSHVTRAQSFSENLASGRKIAHSLFLVIIIHLGILSCRIFVIIRL